MALLTFIREPDSDGTDNNIYLDKLISYDVSSSAMTKEYTSETGSTIIYGTRKSKVTINFTAELAYNEIMVIYNHLQNYIVQAKYYLGGMAYTSTFKKSSDISVKIVSKSLGIYQVSCTLEEV